MVKLANDRLQAQGTNTLKLSFWIMTRYVSSTWSPMIRKYHKNAIASLPRKIGKVA